MKRRGPRIAVICAFACFACRATEPSSDTESKRASPPTAEPATPQSADALLANALLELSEQPAWLSEPPERIHAELGLGERFELHRYSEGLGETERVGFSIRPKRTEVIAGDLAKAMALEAAAHEQVPITDRNRERLANAGETPFVWKGLQLEIELAARERGLGLQGWSISDVLVLPPERAQAELGERIAITPDEAAAVGLPKLGFSLDTTGLGMSGSKLEGGVYLHLSGPPGGPMILRISPATIGAKFADVVGGDQPLDATLVEEQVELLGGPRRAAAWITGASLARTSWCAVLLGSTTGKPEDPALLLELGIGHQGDDVACKTALENPKMKPVIASLQITGL